MSARGGKFYQKRWQIGFDGSQINIEEREAVYLLGSGNHARTWLARGAGGKLIELPLGWYAEKGGYWGMNPGYDTLHPPAQRAISYECMFCHNAYPQIPAGHNVIDSEPVFPTELPQGIDCQRCHGPGGKHVELARRPGVQRADLHNSIVNPARLSTERRLELCMQCHLETTSTRLPALVRRFDRAPFSYVPGQPLGDFVLSFDHAPNTGHEDKFEIAGAAYRLRLSRCFIASKGQLTCTTCHDPHDIPRGISAERHYAEACRQCHSLRDSLHTSAANCTDCHMPKRRTEDAVHVIVTDHLIARRPPARDLLASLAERHPTPAEEYHGEVVPYYPAPFADDPAGRLYTAAAQVVHGSNLAAGVPRLAALLGANGHVSPEFHIVLGDAWRSAGDWQSAAEAYHRAGTAALRQEGAAWREAGDLLRSGDVLRAATRSSPADPRCWLELGVTLSRRGMTAKALEALRKSIDLDPNVPDAWNTMGLNQQEGGEQSFRRALQIDPYHAAAHAHLAKLLALRSDRVEAIYHFEKAAQLQPLDAVNRYEYALTLAQMNRFDESQVEVEAAVHADPAMAEAHELLGGLYSRKRDSETALREYREAVRLKPDFGRAQLDLAAALAARGDLAEAVIHLREAARSPDSRVSEPAARALRQIEQARP
jgi:tetratricopeptide (TPR) repeat protein